MKKFFFILVCLAGSFIQAQTTSGLILYTRTVDFQRDVTPEMKASMGNMPAKFESEHELLFDKTCSLYRLAPDLSGIESSGGGGMMRRMMMNGDENYCEYANDKIVSRFEVGEEVYVVTDTIAAQAWKLTNETKDILGYTCHKATTTRTMQRRKMVVENGQQMRKDVTDTVDVEAWYTDAIACPSGPDFAGTLPGMILELTMGEGRFHIIATDFRKKFPKAELKAPEGTAITRDELKTKQEEYFKQFRMGR